MSFHSIVQFDQPYHVDVFYRDLEALCAAYPLIHTEVIGSSVMGKPIHAIRLGEGSAVRLHYNGAFHANEWITSMLLMRFVEECARALYEDKRDNSISSLFNGVSLWVVPMVNPDGVDLVIHGIHADHPRYWQIKHWNHGSELFGHWKANIRGVDLNDQFPAHWEEEVRRREVEGPGPRDYPGTAPLSEPEAQALAEFTRRMDFQAVLAFHTQGEEIYWNYRGYEPPEASELAEQLANSCNYAAIELTGSDAGYKDWFIQEFRRPGFTIEVGYGENPLPIEEAPAIYRRLKPLLLKGMELFR